MKRRPVDERGRLFGKINLLDLLIIGFFLLLLPGGYYFWQLIRTGGEAQQQPGFIKLVPLVVTVNFPRVHEVVYAAVKVGDEVRDNRNKLVGRVSGILSDRKTRGSTPLVLQITVLAEPGPRRRYKFLDASVLKIGEPFRLETERYIIGGGTVVDFQVLEGSDSLELPAGEVQGSRPERESPGTK
ncbi:DUF4330 domain-containing protein [Nitrospinae bacterium AH_259_B05_G02_I21]|nr:DUF4330 domain-containing protein [Nitrospinae bacterium AH_259_B05_G02_I21]MDA2931643.1 DUF4330 domain-containing protein [Nitrospinae bacterium AH-259-F20]